MKRKIRYGKYKGKINLITVLSAALILVGAYIYSEFFSYTDYCTYIHFIDVDQGDASLVISGDISILIDTGISSESDRLVTYVKMYTDDIDYLILTHPHSDHIGGAPVVIENFEVKNIIMPDAVSASEAKTFDKILDLIDKKKIKLIEGIKGVSFSAGECEVKLLGPVKTDYSNLNNVSIVTKITIGGISALFTGDAEDTAENDIMDNTPLYELRSNLLKVGHHGSSTSTSNKFLDAVSPDIAVISCGKNNTYGHPHSTTLKKLEERKIKIYRTDKTGDIVFKCNGKDITLK